MRCESRYSHNVKGVATKCAITPLPVLLSYEHPANRSVIFCQAGFFLFFLSRGIMVEAAAAVTANADGNEEPVGGFCGSAGS